MERSLRYGVCVLLLYAGASGSSVPMARAQTASEYQVKAAYVYAFTKFVEWPSDSFASSNAPIQMCVWNDSLFESELRRLTMGKSVAGHPVNVTALENAEESRKCHLLFVNSRPGAELRHVLDVLHGASVLTVGGSKGFIEAGGMINLVTQDEHIGFQVNHKLAKQAGIQMSARLLSVASRVIE
jgi:YfiR/HmsC-like